jgi:branched-chain amino acid transport system permease protein
MNAALRTAQASWPWLALAAALIVLPRMFRSDLALTMMSVMCIMSVFALSYNMLLGQTGLLSFGHAVYYGLAGFVTVHAMNALIRSKVPVPLPAIPFVGALAGLAFGIIFGSVSTRRAGTVFAMISLGLGELVAASSLILRGFFGGEEGVSTNRTRLAPLLGYKFGPQIEVFYLIAAWTFLCILAMYAITRTPFGRMCNAVRENPERVEFIGYRTQAVRFIAFSLSGLFAGVAGALAAINFEIMNVQSVGAAQSGIVLLMTFVGGIGLFVGPIIGAILITFLQLMLSDVTGAWMLYFGLLFIVVVTFFPEGIAGWLAMHQPVIRSGLIGLLLPSYLLIAGPLVAAVAGCILLVELAHRMLVEAASEGSSMQMFSIAFDAASPVPWVIALALFLGGAWLTYRLWPHVSGAWGDVLAKMHRRAPA